jgi:steroid delta-isomerase
MTHNDGHPVISPNAIVDDPVGSLTLTTPEAILAQGRAFVAAFETVGLEAEFVHTIDYEAVARWTGRGLTKEGRRVRLEGINIFKFDEDGKILSLKGY